nr:protein DETOXIFICATION 43 [Ipomoea batatas]
MAENHAVQAQAQKTTWNIPFLVVFSGARSLFKLDDLGLEILRIALPAALALAADPIASLIDTAFIGHLGAVEIAAVGVAISIINQANKVTIFPLVNITTSFVAEEDTVKKMAESSSSSVPVKGDDDKKDNPEGSELEKMENGLATRNETKESAQEDDPKTNVGKSPIPTDTNANKKKTKREKRNIPSASTALAMGTILGLLQTAFLMLLAKHMLGLMGIKSGSPMLSPALKYLVLRALGAPAVLLSLAMQGVFRGLKDTTTPLYATAIGDLANIILDPIFIFACHWGVSGAAIAHVISQYLLAAILFFKLVGKVELVPPSLKDLQFSRFLKNGFWLLARVIAVTFCVTLGASLAARLGATTMAAFQAILACAFAEKDYKKAKATAARVLQMGVVMGYGLAAVVGVGLYFGSGVFSKDKNVIRLITIGVPFVAGTQPINSLAFVLDGVNFGASDFSYSAYSMVLVAVLTVVTEFLLSKSNGYIGIWIALSIFMVLRTIAGLWRMGTGTGPWSFLRIKKPNKLESTS